MGAHLLLVPPLKKRRGFAAVNQGHAYRGNEGSCKDIRSCSPIRVNGFEPPSPPYKDGEIECCVLKKENTLEFVGGGALCIWRGGMRRFFERFLFFFFSFDEERDRFLARVSSIWK